MTKFGKSAFFLGIFFSLFVSLNAFSEETGDNSKSSAADKKPLGLVGITGNLWAYPQAKTDESGNSGQRQQDFSGGVSFIGEAYVIPYLTLGGMFDVAVLAPQGHYDSGDLVPMISVDFMIRALYPFGSRKQFEPYLRFAVGYTAFLPTPNFREGLAPYELPEYTGHGWNVKVLPGFLYRTSVGVAFLVEMGWAGAGYDGSYQNSNDDTVDAKILYHALTVNFGIAYVF